MSTLRIWARCCWCQYRTWCFVLGADETACKACMENPW